MWTSVQVFYECFMLFNSSLNFSLRSKFWVVDLVHPGGGGGTPLYGLYRYVRPQRVGFFSRFGHK